MKIILIDTCAWIDFFKSQTGQLGNQVAKLIEMNQAAITGIVITELLQGIKNEKESKRLQLLLQSIHYLKTEENDWIKAGQLAGNLRTKGLTLPLTDVLIATIAQRHDISILTIDKHFQHLPVNLLEIQNG